MSGLNNPSKYLFKSYTLIEVIMVMVIIAILTVSFFPRFNTLTSAIRLKGVTKKVMTDIRYAQSVAMSQHVNTTVHFGALNDYRAYYTVNGTNLTDPFTRRDLAVELNDLGEAQGISISLISFNGGGDVMFDYRGVPYDNTGSILTANGTVFLENTYAVNATVIVIPRTGMVTVSE